MFGGGEVGGVGRRGLVGVWLDYFFGGGWCVLRGFKGEWCDMSVSRKSSRFRGRVWGGETDETEIEGGNLRKQSSEFTSTHALSRLSRPLTSLSIAHINP